MRSGGGVAAALVAAVAFQVALFVVYARREIVWVYPERNDQATYLDVAYSTYETLRAAGPSAAWAAASTPLPNGFALPAAAGFLFVVTGPSRIAALAIGLALFVALELAYAWCVARAAGEPRAAMAGAGLLLCAATPFFWAGGLFDFRLDFAAFTLYGIFCALVAGSDGFVSRRTSLLAGVAAAALVATRFVAAAYLAAFFVAAALLFALVRPWRGRLAGLALFGAPPLVVGFPLLWSRRAALYDYYVVLHVTGPEKAIRAAEVGATGFLGALLFYPKSIAAHHLGPLFLLVSVALLGRAFARRAFWGEKPVLLLLLLAAAIPVVALTLDVSKSPVAGNVVVGPVALLVALLAAPRGDEKFLRRGAPALLALGAAFWGYHLLHDRPNSTRVPQLEEIDRLHDEAFAAVRDLPPRPISVVADRVLPEFDAQVFRAVTYERHRALLATTDPFAGALTEVDEARALAAFRDSDLALVTTSSRDDASPFPRDASLARMKSRLREVLARHSLVGTFTVGGRAMALYGPATPAR